MKKILATTLLTIVLSGVFTPVFSIEDKSKNEVKRVEKVEEILNKTDYINVEWWNNFNDPYLTEYILKAVNYNHDLKIATLSTKEFYEISKIQFANQLPSASIGYAPAFTKFPNVTSSDFQHAVPMLANYEIDLFLKNRDKTKVSKKDYEISLLNERSAYITITSAVGSCYLNILKLDKIIKLQEEIVTQRELIFDLMSKRNKEGITSTADMTRANKAFVAATTELTELQKQRETLINAFCTLIGESSENANEIVRGDFDSLNFTGVIPESISTEIIEQRPDYLKAVHNVEKAGLNVKIAKKEFLPSFNIGGLALFNATDFGKLFNTVNMFNAVGGMANINIFRGGAKKANLKLKKHSYEKTLEMYRQTNLTAVQEINDSLVYIKKDNEKLQNTLKMLNFEEKDNNYFQKRYNEGIVSKLDLAQSNENLLSTTKLSTIHKTDCLIDYISLYKAVGAKI